MEDKHSIPQSLTKEQKTGFVLLLIFGVLAVALGFLQMRNTIYQPFVLKPIKIESPSFTIDDETKLQMIDTDQDGLNDYEELNFYQTSPYLPDTDSDGIEDKTEVDKKTDPLCPSGKECGSAENMPSVTTSSKVLTSPLYGKDGDFLNLVSPVSGQQMQDPLSGFKDIEEMINDPVKIREMLLKTGKIDKKQLEEFSDSDLLFLVKDVSQGLNMATTSTEKTGFFGGFDNSANQKEESKDNNFISSTSSIKSSPTSTSL